MNGRGYIPVKLYLQKQVADQGFFVFLYLYSISNCQFTGYTNNRKNILNTRWECKYQNQDCGKLVGQMMGILQQIARKKDCVGIVEFVKTGKNICLGKQTNVKTRKLR